MKREPIICKAFVTIDGKEYDLDELGEKERAEIGTKIKLSLLNSFFAGQATFTAPKCEGREAI